MEKESMVRLVQGQLDAYNQRDIDKFCQFYHPQVECNLLTEGDLICKGMASFRKIYEERFRQFPDLHCELRSRVILPEAVLDEEWVTGGMNTDKPSHVVAVYRFDEGLISKVWFIR